MNRLSEPGGREEFLDQIRKEAMDELDRAAVSRSTEPPTASTSNIPYSDRIPQPPAWGAHVVRNIPLDALFDLLNRNELFRLSWGAKNAHGDEWVKLQAEFDARLDAMHRDALKQDWYQPQGVYGYWPAQSDGNDLVVYDPGSLPAGEPVELTALHFPASDARG